MTKMVRYGVVGCGMMGREHIANLLVTPGATIRALADPEAASRRAALDLIGDAGSDVAEYEAVDQLVSAGDVDAIVLATPNYLHRATIAPILEARLPVLCEKPIATRLEDMRWIVEQVEANKLLFWTGMEYRYSPPMTRFVAQLHAGRIGPIRMLALREHRFPFLEKVNDWNRFSEYSGGTMVEKCCHFFDLMRLILRSEPVRVYCSGGIDVNHLDERYDGRTPDIIDNSYTIVDFANGARSALDLCMFADGAEHQEEFAAVGDHARLELKMNEGVLIYSPRTGFGQPKRPEREHVTVDDVALNAGSHHGATFYQHQDFLTAVRGERQPGVTARDGMMAAAIGVAAEISTREKRAVMMSELGF